MSPQQFLALKNKSILLRHEAIQFRKTRLKKILVWVKRNESQILEALKLDFNKSEFETSISEILPVLNELNFAIKNIEKWTSNEKVTTPLSFLGNKSYIRYENKGVVLIIAPWNYPFQLAVVPLISALAAGNTAVLKPSELTPNTSELIKNMIDFCFSENEVLIELGGKEKTEELLKYDFDHVFFTGSTEVGKIIATSCASRLIPTTLELGGKSPAIVDETANLDEAAEMIFWGKFLNRAQTCIAPDYLVVHENVAQALIEKISSLAANYDKIDKASIITARHHERLKKIAETSEDLNSKTLILIELKSKDHPAMQEELFGPVLPYLIYQNWDQLKTLVLTHEKPLSLYVFSKNSIFIENTLREFPSGGAAVNSVLLHFGNHYLPFGGVGKSGHGSYHGHRGFLEMSHARAVMQQSYFYFLRKLLMPPYSELKHKIIKFYKGL